MVLLLWIEIWVNQTEQNFTTIFHFFALESRANMLINLICTHASYDLQLIMRFIEPYTKTFFLCKSKYIEVLIGNILSFMP